MANYLEKPPDPRLEDWQNQLWNYSSGRSPYEKWAKRFLNKYESGADVSDYGELANVRQLGATQGAGVDMNYMTGANQLLATEGNSEDVSQMNRQRDLAHQRVNQETGRNEVAALGNARDTAIGVGTSERNARLGRNLQAQETALGSRLGYYGQRYNVNPALSRPPFWQSLITSLISGGAAVGSAAVGGGP